MCRRALHRRSGSADRRRHVLADPNGDDVTGAACDPLYFRIAGCRLQTQREVDAELLRLEGSDRRAHHEHIPEPT